MSASECARVAGISRQRVQVLLKQGRTHAEIIDAVRLRRQSEQDALAEEPAHHSRTGSAAPAPLAYSVRKKAEADAELKALELRRRRGELVEVSRVGLYVQGCIIAARQRWMGLADLAPQVRQSADDITAQELIDTEIRHGLGELERFSGLVRGAIAGGGDPLPDAPPEVQQALGTLWEYSQTLRGGAVQEAAREGGDQ